MLKKTLNQFLKECRKVRGDRFDYSKVEYKGVDIKTTFTCKKHGDLQTTPYRFLRSKEPCKGCEIETKRRVRLEKYEEKLKKVNKYFREGVYEFLGIDRLNKNKGIFKSDFGLHSCYLQSMFNKDFKLDPTSSLNINLYYHNMLMSRNEGYRQGKFYVEGNFKDHKSTLVVTTLDGVSSKTSLGSLLQGRSPRRKSPPKIKPKKESKKDKNSRLNLERVKLLREDYKDVDYSLWDYETTKRPMTFRCKIHNMTYLQRIDHHLNNVQACPKCKERRSLGVYTEDNIKEQHPNTNGYLYVIKVYDKEEIFYKVGISKRNLRKRFAEIKSCGYNVEVTYSCKLKLLDAFYKEQYFLDLFQEFSYTPLRYFGGYTECFSENVWQIFYDWNCAEEKRSRHNDKLMCEEHGIDYEQQLIP